MDTPALHLSAIFAMGVTQAPLLTKKEGIESKLKVVF